MVTTVVNLHDSSYDICIGRDGAFGNPICMGTTDCPICHGEHKSKGSTIPCFRVHMFNRTSVNYGFYEEVETLRGKVLGCFCKPNPCHGDVYVNYLNDVPINSFTGPYRFLSNFYSSPIRVKSKKFGELLFPTVEHAFQASKTHDEDGIRHVMAANTPGMAKKQGREVILRDDWEDKKVAFMRYFVSLKFMDMSIARMLMDTGDCHFIEGNTWGDRFWGVCDGKGQNVLGRILMARHAYLQRHVRSV